MKVSRRQFLKTSLAAGALVGVGSMGSLIMPRSAHAATNSPNLTKWIQPIRGLTALGDANGIPVLSSVPDPVFANTDFYQVTAGEFTDQLHPALGPTRLWGYWDTTSVNQKHLGGVIVTPRGKAARIRFTNTLPSTHIIPVDTSLPGANQAQNRIAIHAHGGLVPWISDGGPFDWWAPDGSSGLSFLNGPGGIFDNIAGQSMAAGQADYFYPNDQSTRLLWYHDHAHGITRLNAYAGLASGFLILDAINAAYVAAGKIPGLASTLPLVFQDKIFVSASTASTDPTWATKARSDVQSIGSLWYDHVYDPATFRLLRGTGYTTPPNPSCIPEFFGDTMLANGLVYPLVTVEAKRYRFFVLNACNARFLNINLRQVGPNADVLTTGGFADATNPPGPQIIQIGTEGGFLVTEATFNNDNPFNPATLTGNLLLAPAERADIIIDFTGKAGQEFMLYNDAPGPFPSGPASTDYYPLDPTQQIGPDTRNILRIKVVAGASDPQPAGLILNPSNVDPPMLVVPQPPRTPLTPPSSINGQPVYVRDLTLNEAFDQNGRLKQLLGTTKPSLVSSGFGLDYLAAPTEVVNAGAIEVWRIFNLTADTHPIHFHLVNVQVLQRQPFRMVRGRFTPSGATRGPEANEIGWKETVQMHPGEVTTVIMKFDLPTVPFTVPSSPRATELTANDGMGLPPTQGVTYHEYVWHCHILEHEEHDMMRPLVVKSTT